jgi:hypothetical protein
VSRVCRAEPQLTRDARRTAQETSSRALYGYMQHALG